MSQAEKIIEQLLEGNQRFLSSQSALSAQSSLEKLRHYAKHGQNPKAIILCCSDSRAPVEMIFDQDIGDLFVIRVAGNIVAPSLVGSVEFAVEAFGTSLIMVMGHSQCGAIRATLEQIEHVHEISSENLHDIVSRIKPHIFSVARDKKHSFEDKMDQAIEMNVRASVAHLSHASKMIEDGVQQGRIHIAGAVLDLVSGRVTLLDGDRF